MPEGYLLGEKSAKAVRDLMGEGLGDVGPSLNPDTPRRQVAWLKPQSLIATGIYSGQVGAFKSDRTFLSYSTCRILVAGGGTLDTVNGYYEGQRTGPHTDGTPQFVVGSKAAAPAPAEHRVEFIMANGLGFFLDANASFNGVIHAHGTIGRDGLGPFSNVSWQIYFQWTDVMQVNPVLGSPPTVRQHQHNDSALIRALSVNDSCTVGAFNQTSQPRGIRCKAILGGISFLAGGDGEQDFVYTTNYLTAIGYCDPLGSLHGSL